MKIAGIVVVIAMAAAPAAIARAQERGTPVPARYAFSCDSAAPLSLTPVSFSIGVGNQTSIGSQSSGAGAGKPTFNPLVVKFPMSSDALSLLDVAETGGHFSHCTLTETVHSAGKGGASTSTYTFELSLVAVTDVSLIGSDGSNTDSGGLNVPTGFVEASFQYGALRVR